MVGMDINYVPPIGAKGFLVAISCQDLDLKNLKEKYKPRLAIEGGGIFFKEDFLLGSLQDEDYFLKFNSNTKPVYRSGSKLAKSNSIWTEADKMTVKECRRFTPKVLTTKIVQYEDLDFEDWCSINPLGKLGIIDLWFDRTFEVSSNKNPYVFYVTCEEVEGK